MASRKLWRKNGKIIRIDDQLIRCDECPCDVPLQLINYERTSTIYSGDNCNSSISVQFLTRQDPTQESLISYNSGSDTYTGEVRIEEWDGNDWVFLFTEIYTIENVGGTWQFTSGLTPMTGSNLVGPYEFDTGCFEEVTGDPCGASCFNPASDVSSCEVIGAL